MILAFIIVVCAGLIQISALGYVSFFGIKPDLLLVLVAFFALCGQRSEAVKVALVLGLIKDLSSFSILGSYTLTFLILALFLNYHQNKFYREKATTQVILLFACYLVMSAFVLCFSLISHKSSFAYQVLLDIALKGATYTALIAPFVFFVLSKILRIQLSQKF